MDLYIAFYRKIRSKDASKVHAQLCLALLMMYFIFLIGIDIKQNIVCTLTSLLIQYFALASVFWMAAEAILMIKKVVIVDLADHRGVSTTFLLVLSICCWGKKLMTHLYYML